MPEVGSVAENTTAKGQGLRIERRFTSPDVHPFDTVEWELRTASVGSFEQTDVEFPSTWSQNATNIVAQKYFRGRGLGSLVGPRRGVLRVAPHGPLRRRSRTLRKNAPNPR